MIKGKFLVVRGMEVVHMRAILVKIMLKEGVSFSQFICDPVVESFLKTLDQGTDGCLNQKLVQDDVNLNLTGIDDECVIPNVDVIDASPVSFAPPLGTLEGPSKPVSGKPKDINEEATSVVDIKGKRQMKFSYVYKSPFKERDIVLLMETDVIGFRANYESLFKKTHLHVSVLDSWSRILNHQEKFRDVVNSPLRLFMNSDTICSKDLLCSMEIIFLSNGGRVLGVSYNLYENLARNMKNKNLGKWGT
ncbi:unnamed protein product [Lactuca virosa]|uniref:Uncharacterized protein n=1 Tax=Lactuca virosa TaxID=75947 RepID=A0AAU9PDD2_9ASTR|nr:unnamed protein product [Lactuca virosa]